jgi:hypothetical protein
MILCIKAMIPTISDDFSATVSEGQNGDSRLRSPNNPRVSREPAPLYPQVGEIGGDESGARAKIDAVSGSPLSVENLPMIHTTLGISLSDQVGSM